MKTTRTILHALGLGLTLALLTSTAVAADPGDTATGAALFQDAQKLAAAGDYDHALPKFLEAQRLLPTPGTLLNIGNCYEKLGKLASAWGAFKEAEVMARGQSDTPREAEAQRRANALAPQLAKLAIVVPPATRVPGFELRRDGTVVGEGQWGSSMPVDVGQHAVDAKAPGYKPWSTVVRIETNGSSASIEVPPLEKQSAVSVATAWPVQRVAGISVGSAGLVSVIVGAVFGGRALSKNNASKLHCSAMDPNFCDDTGVSLRREAKAAATVSTTAIVVGGAAVVGGIVLFVVTPGSPKQAPARLEIIPRLGSLTLRGTF